MHFAVAIAVLALAGCVTDLVTYAGGVADARYVVAWDAERVAGAVEAMGGEVEELRDAPPGPRSTYLGHATYNGTLLTFIEGREWSLRVVFDGGQQQVGGITREEARALLDEDRARWDPAMERLVAAFDTASGWRHQGIEWDLRAG